MATEDFKKILEKTDLLTFEDKEDASLMAALQLASRHYELLDELKPTIPTAVYSLLIAACGVAKATDLDLGGLAHMLQRSWNNTTVQVNKS